MKLAYREYGEGKPFLILHGLFGQSDNWNTLAKKIAGIGCRVFTIDQRNHGLSPHSDSWDYEVMAKDLNLFIQEHSIINPILLGHSMGGKTVMFHEMLYPNIADKIIIVDIAPRAYTPQHDDVIKALHQVKLNEITGRKEAEEVLEKHITDTGVKQFLLKNLYWKDAENKVLDWRFNLKVISNEYNTIGVEVPYGKSHVKALFIKGEKSIYLSENDLSDIEKRFPCYTLKIIPGAGHWVHAEKPEEFFSAVKDFI